MLLYIQSIIFLAVSGGVGRVLQFIKSKRNLNAFRSILHTAERFLGCNTLLLQDTSCFTMLFSDKRELLGLYNAVSGKDYKDPGLLEVNTLENAIYMAIKNDLSFVIDSQLSLYEHQSTYSPNLPLRMLLYLADLYADMTKNENLYGKKKVKIPPPQFIIFYNGVERQPDRRILRLSDLYEVEEEEHKLELEAVERIVRENPDSVVIVDEAYVDFAGKSAMELIDRYDNLIVTQTFSKSRSMAGMRIGFAVSNPDLIRCLNDVKYSFNSYTMSRAALVCGAEAVKDRNYFEESISRIIATRERAKEELKKLGFVFTDSRANFLFAKHPDYDGGQLFEELKAQKIYVRHWPGERLGQYLRITVGTDEEMDRLFDFLRKKIR